MARMCGMKFRVYPTKEQREQLAVFFDVARWTWNHLLAAKQEERKRYKKISDAERALFHWMSKFDMDKLVVQWKKQPETCWMKKASAHVLQNVTLNLSNAFAAFLKGLLALLKIFPLSEGFAFLS